MTKSVVAAVALHLISASPLYAQDCNETCFLINNTFSQETLKRFVAAYPNSPHIGLAEKRLSYLDRLKEGAVNTSDEGFPQPKKTETFRVPASQAPQKAMQP